MRWRVRPIVGAYEGPNGYIYTHSTAFGHDVWSNGRVRITRIGRQKGGRWHWLKGWSIVLIDSDRYLGWRATLKSAIRLAEKLTD